MIATDLDDAFEAAGKRKPVAELPQQWLPNGYMTLIFPCGTHKTLRIHTQQGGTLAGKRIISLLIGPDNTQDYQGFAELIPLPPGFWVWKAHKGKRHADYPQLLLDLARGVEIEGHELQMSKRCLRCNRPLTTPASLAAGIGPECERRG